MPTEPNFLDWKKTFCQSHPQWAETQRKRLGSFWLLGCIVSMNFWAKTRKFDTFFTQSGDFLLLWCYFLDFTLPSRGRPSNFRPAFRMQTEISLGFLISYSRELLITPILSTYLSSFICPKHKINVFPHGEWKTWKQSTCVINYCALTKFSVVKNGC